MRNNNLVVRRNVRNSKNVLVESIMAKVAPIVKNAINEKFDMKTAETEGEDGSIEVPTDVDFIYYNNEGGGISFETQSSLKKILKYHDYKKREIEKALNLQVFETCTLTAYGEVCGMVMRIDDVNE